MAHTNPPLSSSADQNAHAKLGYETRDIAFNTLGRWLLGLFVFIGVAAFGSLGLYKLLVPTYAETERVSPLEHLRTYPPNPQLQSRPRRDMIEYRAAEEKIEKGYTKGTNGTVNLPVDRAVDLLAERGISGVKGSANTPAPSPDNLFPLAPADRVSGNVTGAMNEGASPAGAKSPMGRE